MSKKSVLVIGGGASGIAAALAAAEKTVEQIAEIMGLKTGTAGVYLQRARDRAKRLFSEKEGQRHEK